MKTKRIKPKHKYPGIFLRYLPKFQKIFRYLGNFGIFTEKIYRCLAVFQSSRWFLDRIFYARHFASMLFSRKMLYFHITGVDNLWHTFRLQLINIQDEKIQIGLGYSNPSRVSFRKKFKHALFLMKPSQAIYQQKGYKMQNSIKLCSSLTSTFQRRQKLSPPK